MAKYERILTDKYTGKKALIKANDWYLFEEKINKKFEAWNK